MKRMKKGQSIAILVVAALILAGLSYVCGLILSDTGKGKDHEMKLGLDLAGGVSITYQIEGKTPTDEQMNDTIKKLQDRITADLGEGSTTEANVYRVGDDRITVEIPGVKDANELLKKLGKPGSLYFISETDKKGNQNYTYDQTTGQYQLTKTIEELEEDGSIVLTGADVKSANAAYQTDQTTQQQKPVVELALKKSGTKAFGVATTAAALAQQTIGIYYDGAFVSVPRVNTAINDGNCIIEGMESFEAAENLASRIRIGGLDLELSELQSEVVGAQLGSDALTTSLKAGGIGLAIVMVFLIVMYLVPGVVAAIALALYTTLIISLLYAFDITLTLPGIAGIILSLGMAVDANVIIFARIREEIASGKTVIVAIENGFKKALSAIVDGNVTTLIAAAVLGVLGSGSVKGFAITLAIGVILSMFTALVVTRLLMMAVYGLGIRSPKFYGQAKEIKVLDFIGKRGVFFLVSILIIGAGLVSMAVHGATGQKSLNYSLEFLGGTSTTVTLDQEYTIEELDELLVPIVSEVTKDNDIQLQQVDGTNQVIIKTKSLNVEERDALNDAFAKEFKVDADSISSENISSLISGEMRRESLVAVLVAALFMLLYIWFRFKDIRFAGSAIIALLHDVLVVLAIYAVARISVGSAFIACMLTVIGYSINDTIVVFDRLRENAKGLQRTQKEELKELANKSISQTLSRSISTSITTAIMVLMLLILGVSSIREFALPLLAGVICGTYSSICLATEIWYVLKVKIQPKQKEVATKKGTKKNK